MQSQGKPNANRMAIGHALGGRWACIGISPNHERRVKLELGGIPRQFIVAGDRLPPQAHHANRDELGKRVFAVIRESHASMWLAKLEAGPRSATRGCLRRS